MAGRPPRTPPWMHEGRERARQRANLVGPGGVDRWQAAEERHVGDIARRGSFPKPPSEQPPKAKPPPPPPGVAPEGLPRTAPAPPAVVPPTPWQREQQELARYAREILAAKPAALDPPATTMIIEGRPVQATQRPE